MRDFSGPYCGKVSGKLSTHQTYFHILIQNESSTIKLLIEGPIYYCNVKSTRRDIFSETLNWNMRQISKNIF